MPESTPTPRRLRRRAFLTGAAMVAAATAIDASIAPKPARADTSIGVYASMPTGALITTEPSGTTISGSSPGLIIKPSGDIIIANRTTFFAALPFTLTTTAGTYDLSFDSADYIDQEQYRGNVVTWFDATDQRTLLVNSDATIEEWADRVDINRRARNDQYPLARPTWVATSQAGANHPAVRSAPPSATGVYGLFFAGSPVYWGLQRLAFDGATKLQVRTDNRYSPNLSGQPQIAWPTASFAVSPTAQLSIVTAVWTKSGAMTIRRNGTEVASYTDFSGGFDSDGMGAVVFYATNAGYSNVCQIFCAVGIGNAYTWKQSGFLGDIFEIFSLTEVAI